MYFGRPGSLELIADCMPNLKGPLTVPDASYVTASGVTSVDILGDPRRTWELEWEWLSETEMQQILAYYSGAHGVGPWVMLEAFDRNMLSPNQASGCDARRDTTGWFLLDGWGTLYPSKTGATQGLYSLGWQHPVSTVSGTPFVRLPWGVQGHFGYPIVPNKDYAFALDVQSTGAISATARIAWLDADGGTISTAEWAPVALAPNVADAISVVGTAPWNAVYADPQVAITTQVAGAKTFLDKLQLEQASAPSVWCPGMGTPQLHITDAPTKYLYKGFYDLGIRLVEVV